MAKNFDIYDFVHNNKITLNVATPKGTTVHKAYNDIRKTKLKEEFDRMKGLIGYNQKTQ